MKGGKKFNISADSPEGWTTAQCKILCISVQFWVNKSGQKFIKTYIVHCTVVTGWYCYYPVSGTRPHYEWVGFFAHHDAMKSFLKDFFELSHFVFSFWIKTQTFELSCYNFCWSSENKSHLFGLPYIIHDFSRWLFSQFNFPEFSKPKNEKIIYFEKSGMHKNKNVSSERIFSHYVVHFLCGIPIL